MDGTRPFRIFRRITLPLLWPNLVVVIILALIRAVQIFDEVFVLTGGGPGSSTLFITQYIYQTGFADRIRNLGLAASASIVMGVVLVVLTSLQLAGSAWRERRERRDERRRRLPDAPARRTRLALHRRAGGDLARLRLPADVRAGRLAHAFILQDAGRADRVSADAAAARYADGDRRGLRQAAAALRGRRRGRRRRACSRRSAASARWRRWSIRRRPARSSRCRSTSACPCASCASRPRTTRSRCNSSTSSRS